MNPQYTQVIFFIAIIAVFWFIGIRPQQQRAKQQREMVARLTVGDEVVTFSGIFGTVVAIGDRLRLASADGSQFEVARQAIADVVTASTDEDAPESEGSDADAEPRSEQEPEVGA